MRKLIIAVSAIAALGLAACTQEEAADAGNEAEAAATEAADTIGEAAHEAGEAVEGAANEAATAVEHATDDNPATTP